MKVTSEQAVSAARTILALIDSDRRKIEALGRPAASALRVFQYAQTNPILSIATAAERIGLSFPTVAGAVGHLQKIGVLRETTGRERGRLFVYEAYLAILNEGTEQLR